MYIGWWNSLTEEEKEKHKESIKRGSEQADCCDKMPVAVVRGICRRCGATVADGWSVFSNNEEVHINCGGILAPVRRGDLTARKTVEPLRYSANVNGVDLSMWETRNAGVRIRIRSMNVDELIIVTDEQRDDFANIFDIACLTLREWNGKRNNSGK